MSPPFPTRVRLTNVSDEDLLMADPFSIAVGALTVAGIARGVGKAVRKLHAFKTAQGDFSALQNEVSDVEAVLQQVASVTYSPVLPGQEEQSDITLRGHIDRAKGQLLELEKLIAYVLTSYDDQAKAKVDKSAWLKQQNKLRSLRKGLRNVRMNLALSIATVTLSV